MRANDIVAILGGGFTGALLAIQLSRLSPVPLDIRIVEPRRLLGAGVTYSSSNPDVRLNGPVYLMAMFRENPGHFRDWYESSGEIDDDPEALASTGQYYGRRYAFGRYMDELVHEKMKSNESGSTISHVAERACDLVPDNGSYRVVLEGGEEFLAAHVFLTVAHEKPAVPRPFRTVADSPRFVADPWENDAVSKISSKGDILIIGSALTMADIVATLMRSGHRDRIVVVSRRGFRPQKQGVLPTVEELVAKMASDPPLFVRRHGTSLSARKILRQVRGDIAEGNKKGERWELSFDDLRDSAPVLWGSLPMEERRRVLRHLRSIYDIHRYRMAPQIAEVLEEVERSGQLTFVRGRVGTVKLEGDLIDVEIDSPLSEKSQTFSFSGIINCTGPNGNINSSPNPLIAALLESGLIQSDPTGTGINIDDDCRVIDRSGQTLKNLRVLGPLTRGHFGDLNAVPQIAPQVLKVIAGLTKEVNG